MSLLRRLADILELLLVAFIAYWVIVLLTKGPEAARQAAEAVRKWVEETAERVKETVGGAVEWVASEASEDVRRCIGYIHETYGLTWQIPGELKTSIKRFCILLAKAKAKGLISEAKAYEMLYNYYAYYISTGESKYTALRKALDTASERLEEMLG